ncbi:hypothetical protein E2C01_011866 [Portunus trituberculatus]|uniref:Uncharacterized protein n=1 Tax=Portunus trituberculatus TaxID=210409 RepID=A0A5B7DCZ9_PORTR|nr:hypothetical protein [Portunus trituberculatus]
MAGLPPPFLADVARWVTRQYAPVASPRPTASAPQLRSSGTVIEVPITLGRGRPRRAARAVG